MTWQDFGAAIETGLATALAADSFLGTGGTYSMALMESEPPQIDDENPELWAAKTPYIGYKARGVDATVGGTRLSMLAYEVRFRVITYGNPPNTYESMNRKIRDRIGAMLRGYDGSASFLSSAHQVLVSEWSAEPPEQDPENPFLITSFCTVKLTVVYPEG